MSEENKGENGRGTKSALRAGSVRLSNRGELLQKQDATHPITNVALALYDHYGVGWSQAEDIAIRAHEAMIKLGWTITPPNDH